MSYVVTLQGLSPLPRYDSLPWTQAKIEESASNVGPWSVIDTITLLPVDADPAHPTVRNLTTPNAVLPGGWYRVSFTDAAGHSQAAPVVANQSTLLVPLPRMKRALDIDPTDSSHDVKILEKLAAASRAVLNYTDRDFGSPNITETRTYLYDGSGVLDIDDASAVTSATVNYPGATSVVLTTLDWFAQPFDKPLGIYEWLQVPENLYGIPVSPQMGFNRNLDQYRPLATQPTTISVNATFGWPYVPEDVVQATEWAAADFIKRPDADLQAHAIEGFSESFIAPRAGTGPELALPAQSKDLLDFYRRIPV